MSPFLMEPRTQDTVSILKLVSISWWRTDQSLVSISPPSVQRTICYNILAPDSLPPPECFPPAPCPLLLEVPERHHNRPKTVGRELYGFQQQIRGGGVVYDTRCGELPPSTPQLWAFPRCANTSQRCLPLVAERKGGVFKISSPSPTV